MSHLNLNVRDKFTTEIGMAFLNVKEQYFKKLILF